VTEVIAHHEFISEGTTVSKERYKVLTCLWVAVHLKHPKMWAAKEWALLHDNTPAHLLLLM